QAPDRLAKARCYDRRSADLSHRTLDGHHPGIGWHTVELTRIHHGANSSPKRVRHTPPGTWLSWLFVLILIVLGVLKLWLIHPVPGLIYMALSTIYIRPVYARLCRFAGSRLPPVIRILLAIAILWFTLGI